MDTETASTVWIIAGILLIFTIISIGIYIAVFDVKYKFFSFMGFTKSSIDVKITEVLSKHGFVQDSNCESIYRYIQNPNILILMEENGKTWRLLETSTLYRERDVTNDDLDSLARYLSGVCQQRNFKETTYGT